MSYQNEYFIKKMVGKQSIWMPGVGTNGLVSWLDFNSNGVDSITGSSLALDGSALTYVPTIEGSTVTGFGTTAATRYEIPHGNSAWNLSGKSFTLYQRFMLKGVAAFNLILKSDSATVSSDYALAYFYNNATAFRTLFGSSNFNDITLGSALTQGVWYNLIISYDRDTDTLIRYIFNGDTKTIVLNQTNQYGWQNAITHTSGRNTYIGTYAADNRTVDHIIYDTIAIWHRALSPSEITELNNNGEPVYLDNQRVQRLPKKLFLRYRGYGQKSSIPSPYFGDNNVFLAENEVILTRHHGSTINGLACVGEIIPPGTWILIFETGALQMHLSAAWGYIGITTDPDGDKAFSSAGVSTLADRQGLNIAYNNATLGAFADYALGTTSTYNAGVTYPSLSASQTNPVVLRGIEFVINSDGTCGQVRGVFVNGGSSLGPYQYSSAIPVNNSAGFNRTLTGWRPYFASSFSPNTYVGWLKLIKIA